MTFSGGRMEVWITNTKTRENLDLTGGTGSSWGPVWSPDGKRLAFYSDRSGEAGLWVWERSTGKARRLSHAIVHPYFWYEDVRWTPDGRSVLCKVVPDGMTLAETINTIPVAGPRVVIKGGGEPSVRVYTSLPNPVAGDAKGGNQPDLIGVGFTNTYLSDLAIVDVATGRLKCIARRVKPAWYSFSPDGSQVAFTDALGTEADSQQTVFDLQVYSLAEDRSLTVVPRVRLSFGTNVSWSPDGKLLSYVSTGFRADGECFIVPAAGGEAHKCANGPHPSFADPFRAPLWDAKGENLYFMGMGTLWRIVLSTGVAAEVAKIPGHLITEIAAPLGGGRFWSPDDGRSLVAMTKDSLSQEAGFYRIDLQSGQTTQLLEENKVHGGSFTIFNVDVSSDGKQIVFSVEDAQHPRDFWIADADFHNPRRVTAASPVFDEYVLGSTRLVDWTSGDGQKLHGALLLPAGYKEGIRYPLVTFVYGGAFGSRQMNNFGMWGDTPSFNMQMLATRGYAVLFPDAPLRKGTPLKDLASTVLPGVDRVIELGIADPDRLAVMGQSFGSYCVLALLVQSTRFKAAVIMSGASPLLLEGYLYMSKDGDASTGYYEEGQGGMGGTPWQYPERYIENSPLYRFDKVETAILMEHGEMDSLPPEWSDGTFVALRRLGKPVEYAVYGGEGHVIMGVANGVDFWNREIAWLERWLVATPRDGQMPNRPPGQ